MRCRKHPFPSQNPFPNRRPVSLDAAARRRISASCPALCLLLRFFNRVLHRKSLSILILHFVYGCQVDVYPETLGFSGLTLQSAPGFPRLTGCCDRSGQISEVGGGHGEGSNKKKENRTSHSLACIQFFVNCKLYDKHAVKPDTIALTRGQHCLHWLRLMNRVRRRRIASAPTCVRDKPIQAAHGRRR